MRYINKNTLLRLIQLNSVFFVAVLIISGMTYYFMPKPELINYQSYSRAYFDNKDQLLRITLAEDDRYRLFTPLEEIADEFKLGTILYEDQHFYQHPGVDFLALLRAFVKGYILGERKVGASTITMQVARLRWHINSRTYSGKLQQIFRAIQLNKHYAKDEILEAYFNLASYGRNIEGVGAASLIYFNKQAKQLNLPESLALSVVPQNPSKRNPTTQGGKKQLKKAREFLRERWNENHPNNQGEKVLFDLPLSVRTPDALPFEAPHFVNLLAKRQAKYAHGTVLTALDLTKQHKIENLVKDYVSTQQFLGIHNAAVILLNHKNMQVEAMLGSADFFNTDILGQVNGTNAKRSPGSTLKPFIYGLAIDQGLIHTETLLKDAPMQYGGFTPENYDLRFLGPISARNALISSRNVPVVELQSKLKNPNLYELLSSAGVKDLKAPSYYGLALGLGGSELTMLELVKLYATLTDQGRLRALRLEKKTAVKPEKRLLSAEASFLVMDMLKDNPAPIGYEMLAKNSEQPDIAWKTGTSWAFRDAWAIGISGDYIAAVWVGNFNGKGNAAFVGSKAAGPLLFQVFSAINQQKNWQVENAFFNASLNLKKISVCEKTGDLPGSFCPKTKPAWFIPGVSPIKLSMVYREIPINIHTGLRECRPIQGLTKLVNYEFWSSDFLRIFKQAGITFEKPPRYAKSCGLDDIAMQGNAPKIRKPISNLRYVYKSGEENKIPFSAVVDTDVKKLFWFVSGKYVGSNKVGEIFLWPSKPGKFEVTVVDDLGRAGITKLNVVSEV